MNRLLAAAVLAVALASCVGGGEDDGDQASGDCPGPGDMIVASRPLVQVRSDEKGCSFTAADPRAIARKSVVRIESGDRGGGQASLIFAGDVGVCALRQLNPKKPAIVVTRHPQGALFQQQRGTSICTIRGTKKTICQDSRVEISGDVEGVAQARIRCDPDPVLAVTPYRGAITVATLGRQWDLAPGQELNVYPDPQSSVPAPEVASTEFATWQVEIFEEQSEMLDVEFVPLVPSPTPSPTITSSPGAPVNVVPPSVSWLTVGETVTSDVGTWDGEPTSFQITWEAGCSVDGLGCRATGVIGDVYSPSVDDCDYVRSVVTATNESGTSLPVPSAPFDIQCVD
jgi:hypothetical protein